MLMFLDIWTKKLFFQNDINLSLLEFQYFRIYGQKATLSKLYVEIFGYMDTKLFSQSDLKKTVFSSKCSYFSIYGQKPVLKVI